MLVTKPEGCSLLRGSFALTHTRALHKIMRSWGTRLTWTTQREHANQIFRGMQSFYDSVAFMTQWDEGGGVDEMGHGDGWLEYISPRAIVYSGDPKHII